MFTHLWTMFKEGVEAFVINDMLSRGAAIAFYAVTALAPILYITSAVIGLVFGRKVAGTAIATEIGNLIGKDGAYLLKTAILNSDRPNLAGLSANVIGVVLLIVTASGVFGEMQLALNIIWKADPKSSFWSRLLRARLVSLGLVLGLAFMLLISLVMSAAINALGTKIDTLLPIGVPFAVALNFVISFVLVALLLAAISPRSTRL